MKPSPIETLELYERVHSTIKSFGKRTTWTPAEGAMLVSGIRPPPLGIDAIPQEAMQLFDEASAATQPQLLDAITVLRQWAEDREFDREEGGTRFDADPTPQQFLEWCDDAFQQFHPEMRPKWLEHFVGRSQGESLPALPPGFVSDMATKLRSADLQNREHLAVAAAATTSGAEHIPKSSKSDASDENPAASDEDAHERRWAERTWAVFNPWVENKSHAHAKSVALAALNKVPVLQRQKFLLVDVQRAIEAGLGKACEDLEKVGTVDGDWAFHYWAADGCKTCSSDELSQVLERWKTRYSKMKQVLAESSH